MPAGDSVISATADRILCAAAVLLAVLMVILEMTVVNVPLLSMMGALGATPDQITWVLTSYIVDEGVVIPISGFLAERLGRKRVILVISVAGFVVSSMLCGQSRIRMTRRRAFQSFPHHWRLDWHCHRRDRARRRRHDDRYDRAGQYKHFDIEKAAHQLHLMMDPGRGASPPIADRVPASKPRDNQGNGEWRLGRLAVLSCKEEREQVPRV